jgi:hypothetical protein
MTELGNRLDHLETRLRQGDDLRDALRGELGGVATAGGLWRIFSEKQPDGGVIAWNAEQSPWRIAWSGQLAPFYAFGEDVFGNQLALRDPKPDAPVALWDHETGTLTDLGLDALTLLRAVDEAGLDWLEPYPTEALQLGLQLAVPPNDHLHWVTPLALGGKTVAANACRLPRVQHLVGHAALWAQIHDMPSGGHVLLKPKP